MTTETAAATHLFSVYKIDNGSEDVEKVDIKTDDIETYTNKLLHQNAENKNKRFFKFSRETTEIARIIQELLENCEEDIFVSLLEEKAQIIASRLLDSQKNQIDRYPGINPPKNGSLIIIFSKREDVINFLITKVDHELYLSLEDFLYYAGLPDEKATQKTCAISFQLVENEYHLLDIIVSDSKPTISTFWYDDFLELKEMQSNEKNTKNAFNHIDQLLSRTVKNKSKKDYNELRNTLLGYFRNNSSFKLDEMINYVVGDYVPDSDEVDIEKLKANLEKLPESKEFDSSFDITVDVIKARFKKSYQVSDKIELRTSDYIENLSDVISAKENELGEKVLEIKNISDEVYSTFSVEED